MARHASIFLVAAEESGDRLGVSLMRELRSELGGRVSFAGIGGRAMASEGLTSLFPIDE
jgi:lipid-A-disaccharide synthase